MQRFKGWEEVRAHLELTIRMAKCDGLNPYKAVEMFLNTDRTFLLDWSISHPSNIEQEDIGHLDHYAYPIVA